MGVGEAVVDGASDVDVGHPAHVLFAGTDFSAEAEFEGGEHTLEGAACLAEDDADAHVDGADPVVFGGLRHVFPFACDIGEEALTGGSGFGEVFVAAVTIDAECGGRDEGVGFGVD